jgi:hypothetical protein
MSDARWASRAFTAGLAGVLAFLASPSVFAQPSIPEPPPPAQPWYDAVQLRAFVDGYYNLNWGFPKPQSYNPPTRDHSTNGFGLAWVGLDAGYDPDPVGGHVSLRFGPRTDATSGADNGTALEVVKEAYASWRPGGVEGKFRFDLGKFDTIVGAEVIDSQGNANYSRGLLFTFAQPLFHTGLRANWNLSSSIDVVGMVANGYNRSLDNNIGKTFGLVLAVKPSDSFSFNLGWIGGPEQDDSVTFPCAAGTAYDPDAAGCAPAAGVGAQDYVVDRGGANEFDSWRHLVDLVIRLDPSESLSFSLNGDYGVEGVRSDDVTADTDPETQKWFGGSLIARYQLDETFAIAGRGEYMKDEDGRAFQIRLPDQTLLTKAEIASGTLTLEARPTENLILRLEQRGDFVMEGEPDKDIFREHERDTKSRVWTTTLGVVVTTN